MDNTAITQADLGWQCTHLSTRAPCHPGLFLNRYFMAPLGITQKDLALSLGISRRRLNELIQGRRGITPDTALRLGAYFRHDPQIWMSMQSNWDLHFCHAPAAN